MLACLRAQDITGFETIVVTNTPPDTKSSLLPKPLNIIQFDQNNIAKARNLGIQAARREFLAFCDDDALPDPGWLRKIMTVFENSNIGGASGFTRGRNGISPQWGGVITNQLAQETKIKLQKTTVFEPDAGSAPILIGTNCAFRKSALAQIGNFDEGFSYYLDDSDISLRLSQAGWALAVLPDCQVHHSFAASAVRHKNRVPKSLLALGRSKAYFCKKHAQGLQIQPALDEFCDTQNKRLNRHFLLGQISSSGMRELQETLQTGFTQGAQYLIGLNENKPKPRGKDIPLYDDNSSKHIVLAGRPRDHNKISKMAKALVTAGNRVSVILLGYSPKYMQVSFEHCGYWRHSGGQFGKINRSEPIWRWMGFKTKALLECQRIAKTRPIDFITFLDSGDFNASLLPQKFEMSSLNGYNVLVDSALWSEQDNKHQ